MDIAAALPLDSLIGATTDPHAQAARLRQAGPDEAREAAESFEGFFISMFLESMFSGIKTDGPFGGGQAETVFRSLMNQEYGQMIARSGGIGVADAVQREILKLQEVS